MRHLRTWWSAASLGERLWWGMILALFVVLLVTCAVPARPDGLPLLPDDALQRCATKALRGDYGALPTWKREAYQHVIDNCIEVEGLAKRTTYCPQCSGEECADGSGVRPGICAASKNIPMHAVVWLASDGLVKVCDRGGAVRVGGGYTRRGETANFDVWVADCAGGCWTGPGTLRRVPWAVVGQCE